MPVEKIQYMDADTLLTSPLQRPFFVVEGLIPQGLNTLCGSPKIGKSWLMLWLALQVARGEPCGNLPPIAVTCSTCVWRTPTHGFKAVCSS